MSRPEGWDVVGYGSDPVPGDRFEVHLLAREYATIGETAREAADMLRRVQGADLSRIWNSDAADSFVDKVEDMPSDLDKAVTSYSGVGDVLQGWSETIDDTQYRADRALTQAKSAHSDLLSAQGRLDDASADYDTYNSSYTSAKSRHDAHQDDDESPAGTPTDAQVTAARNNRDVAAGRVASAKADISSAQSRIDAAKRLVDEARGDWADGESATERGIKDAGDAGLGKEHWWDRVFQSELWDTLITICKVVVAIAGVIVLIIGGPLAWVVLAAALLVLADTLYEMAQGRAGWGDVVFALLDCIPGAKGLTTAAGVMKGLSTLAKTGTRALGALTTTVTTARTALKTADVAVTEMKTVVETATHLDVPSIALRFKDGWNDTQKVAAIEKVTALQDLADEGRLVKTVVDDASRSFDARKLLASVTGKDALRGLDVDHIHELQLGGAADDILNLKALDPSVNRSLGAQIRAQIADLDFGTIIRLITIE
ncbi:hypothetical protein QT381_06610 [Galbitalea sp. SE-J8]|uniref:putative T7SS-secreted protein n=1 Tax=Galbitalea sp. SE-J8 TaxID=3054952 RepID=UPI00259CDFED|nr:hypothetical protein [Galbitalea sp. SE-J8]MDM4762675.1 hypothetical protein [Galbitalea sp. SE-J8]